MRNVDSWSWFKSALVASTLLATLQVGESFGQPPRIAFSPKRNSVPNQQQSIPQSPKAQPNIVAQPADQFQELLDRAIEITSKRYLTANSHSPWQIFHCILAMREECVLRLGNEKVNAIKWLSTTEPQFDKEPWLLLTPHGAKFHPYTKKYYFEGHPAQFLALLTHSNLPLDHQFHVQGKIVTLNDLINNTMKEVNTKEEVTWVLWALQHHLKSDATWVNQANEPWSIERLVQIESAAPVVGTPCGGNHRLFALTRARDKYLKSGGQLRGVWLQADMKIKQHIEIARSLQNSDGSFSSASYKGPGQSNDVNERFNTTGHTMEFLSIALPDERLNEPWVRNAVWMLSRELIINRDTQIDCGPLFHSLDSLILYRDRIRPKTTIVPVEQAQQPAEPKVELPSGIDLNSKPDPVKITQAPKPAPEATAVQPNPNELNSPEASIQSVPELKVPEPKTAEPNAPIVTEPQAASSRIDFKKPRDVSGVSGVPRIDPSKLANIGQAAPTTAVGSERPKHDYKNRVRRERVRNMAPELLPEISATPLLTPEQPATPSSPTNETVGKHPLRDEIAANETSQWRPTITEVPIESEEPASALEPANAPVQTTDEP